MLNAFTPFPRYENAIFVGDTATEALAQLRIFGNVAPSRKDARVHTLRDAKSSTNFGFCRKAH